ncbi:hypothetical protein [Corynebacterium diphtheriae]|uniref:hypothetical protein n=1 Tax=Corynebacterium diphtheriae TaxID=1717 RepID=UPI002119BC54|nr:hypothetical protein [Corynebacterium diphtheriae]
MIGSGSQRKIGIVIKALLDQAEELDIINKNKIRCTDIPAKEKQNAATSPSEESTAF